MLKQLIGEDSPPSRRKTKIVATVGPASRSPQRIEDLIRRGVNVFRLNFSHGSYDDHLVILNTIRQKAQSLGAYVGILQDLAGPKIRISVVEDEKATLKDGDQVILRHGTGSLSNSAEIFVESVNPAKALSVGDEVLMGDGWIALEAQEILPEAVVCVVRKGGRIRSRLGIAFPSSDIQLPAATDKDLLDLKWGIEHGVDFVAVSFVNTAKDIVRVREEVKRLKGDVMIIAKIERKFAVERIDEILEVSDGIMVARGDLGVELPLEKIPMIQKLLIEHANDRGVPAIVATQMLQSMVTSVRPTRAEVSDVSNAVLNNADAVMLSEETAIGENPLQAVEYLHRIVVEAERSNQSPMQSLRPRHSDHEMIPDAVAYAACSAAIKSNAAAIIACTSTGYSARLTAKYRPMQPLYGTSSTESTLRRMCLMWGVIPISCDVTGSHHDEIQMALKVVQTRENLPNGSKAVITGGLFVQTPGATCIMEIRDMNFA